MSVDRCVCHQMTFDELAREWHGATLDRIMDETGCGTRCGLCVPYLKLMLVTGKTRFAIMSDAKAEKLLKDAMKGKPAPADGMAESSGGR